MLKERSLKILLPQWHNPQEVVFAGGFKRTFEILKRIPDNVTVHVLDNGPSYLRELEGENIRITEYRIPSLLRRLEKRFFKLERLTEWFYCAVRMTLICLLLRFKGERYDVVFSPTSEMAPSLLAGIAAKLVFGSRLVLCNLNIDVFPPFIKAIVARLHNLADTVITISADLKNRLNDAGVRKTVLVSSVGLDTRYIEEVISSAEAGKTNEAVFVGRHVTEKGILDVFKVWELVTKEIPDAHLLTIGSFETVDKEKVVGFIEELGIGDRVRLAGVVEEREKFLLMKSSKLCLFPSYIEGWGLVPQEALACGLPVIVYDLPVYKENIAPCGAVFMAPIGDVEGLARLVLELLASQRYVDFENIGPEFVKRFGWDEVAQREFGILKDEASRLGSDPRD